MSKEEEEELTSNNSGFQQQPLEIQYLYSYFRVPEGEEVCRKYTAVQLLDIISTRSGRKFSNTSSVAFGRMLNASGIPKVHTYQGNYYNLVEK